MRLLIAMLTVLAMSLPAKAAEELTVKGSRYSVKETAPFAADAWSTLATGVMPLSFSAAVSRSTLTPECGTAQTRVLPRSAMATVPRLVQG